MVNIQDLFDDAKCYLTIREMRWPDGVTCPRCSSDSVLKNGRAKAVRFATLDAICTFLHCQPGDVLRWVDDETADPGSDAAQ